MKLIDREVEITRGNVPIQPYVLLILWTNYRIPIEKTYTQRERERKKETARKKELLKAPVTRLGETGDENIKVN